MKRADSGSILLEALVAIAVLSVSITVIVTSVSNGAGRLLDAAQEDAAYVGALAIINRVGAEIPLTPGNQTGTTIDGWSWRVSISPFVSDGLPPSEAARSLFDVQVEYDRADSRGSRAVLRALRLARAP
ncbi:hypothetical protein SAMN05444161_4591 [Rhizobiales bacterium GAS191]|nr:hypothetical protein SAMN05444161_4591 [Rhizobiales bacterium GAS191]